METGPVGVGSGYQNGDGSLHSQGSRPVNVRVLAVLTLRSEPFLPSYPRSPKTSSRNLLIVLDSVTLEHTVLLQNTLAVTVLL